MGGLKFFQNCLVVLFVTTDLRLQSQCVGLLIVFKTLKY